MTLFCNPMTGKYDVADLSDKVPSTYNATWNYTKAQCKAAGWRLQTSKESPGEGYRVDKYGVEEIDDEHGRVIIVQQTNLAEEAARQAAEAAARKEAAATPANWPRHARLILKLLKDKLTTGLTDEQFWTWCKTKWKEMYP